MGFCSLLLVSALYVRLDVQYHTRMGTHPWGCNARLLIGNLYLRQIFLNEGI
jgi:hypothetical protein